MGPKEVTEKLNVKGVHLKDGAVREMCSRMAKDGQLKSLGWRHYVTPTLQKMPDNADKLT